MEIDAPEGEAPHPASPLGALDHSSQPGESMLVGDHFESESMMPRSSGCITRLCQECH